MSFNLNSTKLLEQLSSVSQRFQGKPIGAKLSVSEAASWWYYHEFGTATHGGEGEFEIPPSVVVNEPAETANRAGYPILPSAGEGIRLPGIPGKNPLVVPQIGAEFTDEHPGVPALGLVRSVMDEIHTVAVTNIGACLRDGEYFPSEVSSVLQEKVMPEVLNIIVESISSKMGRTQRNRDEESPGKLDGESPADVFKGAATISEAEE